MKRRTPQRSLPKATVQGAKVKFAEAAQNPPNEWQQWLRRGCLCRSKVNLNASGRSHQGVQQAFVTFQQSDFTILKKGEFCVYLGELSRTKRKDFDKKGHVKVVVVHYFLFPTGMYVGEPVWFTDGESETQT